MLPRSPKQYAEVLYENKQTKNEFAEKSFLIYSQINLLESQMQVKNKCQELSLNDNGNDIRKRMTNAHQNQ